MKSSEFYDAVDVVNDATEHQFGMGPIEDGGPARERAIRAAKKVARDYPKQAPSINWAISILQADSATAR